MEIEIYKPTVREYKGKSLLNIPVDYTVIDLETTGLYPAFDSILELSAIRVRNKVPVDTYQTLVNDGNPYIDEFITDLTGITEEMIAYAPDIETIFPQFLDFIGDDIVVGHNVNFDVNFVYDHNMNTAGKPFANDFVDTMRLGRRLNPELSHHRLADMAAKYNVPTDGAHRAGRDCEITHAVLEGLRAKILSEYGSEENFVEHVKKQRTYSGANAKDIHGHVEKNDPDNILYGKVCVFTGTLEKMTRAEGMQIVADIGGLVGNNVTKKTNYLILGNNDYCSTIKNGKSNKQKKAETLKTQGQDIEIIPEAVFYEIIQR